MFGNTFKILCSLPWIQGSAPEEGKSPLPPKSFSTSTRTRALSGLCVLIGIVQLLSHVWLFVITCLATNRLPCLSLFHVVSSNSCPLGRWCHLTISSFYSLSFWPQSFPASGSLPMNWVFTSGGLSVGASSSASVLPLNIALPLPKQNSCFQTPNNIEHW